MNNQQKLNIIQTMNQYGMTVLLTKDHAAIMLELAILRRFEHRVRQAADVDIPLQMLVKDIDHSAAALRDSLQQPA